jgi:hypothetical protein
MLSYRFSALSSTSYHEECTHFVGIACIMLGLQKDAYALNISTDDTVNSIGYADDRYGQALSIIRNFSAH